jgi:hypothetical protein
MVLMSAPEEDTKTASTFGANLFAGYNEPERQKFAEIESQANVATDRLRQPHQRRDRRPNDGAGLSQQCDGSGLFGAGDGDGCAAGWGGGVAGGVIVDPSVN